jgi:murein DD-endopeptidase MepM/ murein hydrolase activator NlpD
MHELPEIENKVVSRPGQLTGATRHFIFDPSNQIFWDDFYSTFYNSFKLTAPIDNFAAKINPYFGYFGYRWHPINFQPKYFHIGIDISESIGHPIQPVYNGFLEYSGFAKVNGNYVIVKHPDIMTKDGFVFQSLYMHCKDLNVEFNLAQKVLREFISKTLTISNKTILKGKDIATLGDTGNKLGVIPHLHLQFEFVKDDKHIAVDPLRLFNKASFQNLTASIISETEFKSFFQEHTQQLLPWEKFWATKI